AREELRRKARRVKLESKLRAQRLRAQRKGKRFELVDPALVARLDSVVARYEAEQDSLFRATVDSLLERQRLVAEAAANADSTGVDSM
ncbi:MAG: hypothetical protein K2I59_02735, partial [Alistipes sp.]|nr:hypothetical protein [Alistipes sp.]